MKQQSRPTCHACSEPLDPDDFIAVHCLGCEQTALICGECNQYGPPGGVPAECPLHAMPAQAPASASLNGWQIAGLIVAAPVILPFLAVRWLLRHVSIGIGFWF